MFSRNDRDRVTGSTLLRKRSRRGLAAVALAAGMVVPSVVGSAAQPPFLSPMDLLLAPADAPKLSDAELLKLGADQFGKGAYEEAQVTLGQVKPEGLAEGDQAQLKDLLGKVEAAMAQRKAARAEFDQGEAALAAKNYAEAIKRYKAAADSPAADEATRKKATDQLAVAEAQAQAATGDLRKLYDQAVEEYKKGDYAAAKKNFQTLKDAGFTAGFMERNPQTFLAAIDQAEKDAAQRAEREKADAQAKAEREKAEAEAKAARDAGEAKLAEGKKAFELGKQLFGEGKRDEARKQFVIARDSGYKGGLFESSPATYLERMDREDREAADRAEREAALAKAAGVSPADAVGKAPATGPATDPAAVAALRESKMREEARRQQDVYMAASLVKKATEAEQAGKLADAAGLYAKALDMDPLNAEAKDGRARLAARLTGAAVPKGTMDLNMEIVHVRLQYAKWAIDQAVIDARNAVEAKDFTKAQESIERARVIRDANAMVFSLEELNQINATISGLMATMEQERDRLAKDLREKTEADIRARLETERLRQIEEKRRTVGQLVKNAQELILDGKYREALSVVRHILELDPRNDYANGVEIILKDRANLDEQKLYRERQQDQMTRHLNDAEEKKIPYNDIMRYPDNWPDISRMRDEELRKEQHQSPADEQAAALLNKMLPEIKFDNVAFKDVVDFLRDITGANIFVNWNQIKAAGVDDNAPISARLRNVKFSKILSTVLSEVSATAKLSYSIDEGVITISTGEELSKQTLTKVYDIRDLIVPMSDFQSNTNFSLTGGGNNNNNGNWGGGNNNWGGGNNNNNRGGNNNNNNNNWGNNNNNSGGGLGGYTQTGKTKDEMTQDILTLIKETVAPDSWRENGGSVGAIRELNGQLIVTQTSANHKELVNLLEQLREQRAIQVTVETRFLTVTRNFLEDVGLDLDFFFNIKNPVHWTPISVSSGSAGFTASPTNSVPGSIGGLTSASPSLTVGGPVPGLAGTFLDQFQVNFLLKATQAQSTATLVTAPRVTLFNGQRAYMMVATQQSYVSNLNPVVGNNAGLFQPTIDTVQNGVLLDVAATVSADRKYVTLTLQPQLSTLIGFFTFQFQSAASGAATAGAGGGIVINPGGGNAGNINGYIQQPQIQITEIRTTVNVPDGGTLLLGGQTIAGEVEREQGVPILSKIPFLKRLFTNRAMAKDEQVLLILVKPTILIQREIEAKQFPLLSNKTGG